MKRTPLARGTKPMARTRMTPRRKLSEEEAANRRVVREFVFIRDRFTCRLRNYPTAGPCWGPLTYHHRRKASAGGYYSVQNGAALCAHHNDEIEANAGLAALAWALGLVVRRGDPEWEALGAP